MIALRSSLFRFLSRLGCLLFHRRRHGPWRAVGLIDWERVAYCPTCDRAWLEYTDGPSPD